MPRRQRPRRPDSVWYDHLRLLTKQQVAELTTYCEQRIMLMVKAKTFPACFPLGPGRLAWRAIDVEHWIECKRLGIAWTPLDDAKGAWSEPAETDEIVDIAEDLEFA